MKSATLSARLARLPLLSALHAMLTRTDILELTQVEGRLVCASPASTQLLTVLVSNLIAMLIPSALSASKV